MPSITTWSRLEPTVRGYALDDTLQARIFDPLWMLARQWQVGEFQGEDNGSPVSARLRGECAQLSRFRPGAVGAGGVRFDPKAVPLETLVERERVRPEPGAVDRLRVSAEAGQHFLRVLAQTPLGTKYHAAFVAAFPLPGSGETALAGADRASLRFLEVMSGRVPDGTTLCAALKRPMLPETVIIESGDVEVVRGAARAFVRWFEELFSEPAAALDAWSPERMEYAFSVAAPTTPETVLTSEYSEGDLDWYHFDRHLRANLGAEVDRVSGVNPLSITRTAIPAPVTYRGMPAPRWWEFEDAAVDFGAVDAEPDDLARMLLVEFAITYGNDWFVIPVDVPVGSLCSVASLVVTDTFGVRTLIPSISRSTHPTSSAWRMFRHSQSKSDSFFLAPTVVRAMEGTPLDDVLFLRDEMANLAWGVERVAEGVSGRAVNRREKDLDDERRRDAATTPTPPNGDTLTWRLASDVPDYWIPLVPVPTSTPGEIRFRRGVTLRQDGSRRPQAAHSRVLRPGVGPLDIFEEEIPREGARVTRSYQFARWLDGRPHLWVGRRKSIGRGEGSSGLRFDFTD